MASPTNPNDRLPEHSQPKADESTESSAGASKSGSRNTSRPGILVSKGKQKVRFDNEEPPVGANEGLSVLSASDGAITPTEPPASNVSPHRRHSSFHIRNEHRSTSSLAVDAADSRGITESRGRSPIRSLRPPDVRASSIESNQSDSSELIMQIPGKAKIMEPRSVQVARSEQEARIEAQRISQFVNSHSDPGSRMISPSGSLLSSPGRRASTRNLLDLNNIPLRRLERRKNYSIEDDTDEDDGVLGAALSRGSKTVIKAVGRYLGLSKTRNPHALHRIEAQDPPVPSGQVTPVVERDPHHYVPRPRAYREGFLSGLLKLYQEQEAGPALVTTPRGPAAVARANESASVAAESSSHPQSSQSSGANTPAPKTPKPQYYQNQQNQSTSSISNLISSSTVLAQPGFSGRRDSQSFLPSRPSLRSKSTGALNTLLRKSSGLPRRSNDSVRIRMHLVETAKRKNFLVRLCHALMTYGAPTHRLEEYMRMSARVLEIQAQFFYLPTCMLIAFGDAATHTTEIRLVRAPHGVDLGKLKDTHDVYKDLVHGEIGVDDAMSQLKDIIKREALHGPLRLIWVYGLSSASVAPFAFGARLIDLPVCFMLGATLGVLQLIIAPQSDVYTNIFEVTAAVVTSFLSRALGSIRGGQLFCFSALAQSSIVLILPGYMLLCGALELQSKSIVAGSVRMVYAVIYSLFLGYGVTVGTTLYGLMNPNATSAVKCENSMPDKVQWIFVPFFTACLVAVNQGRLRQMPVMIVISFVGYIVNHYGATLNSSNFQFSQAMGALVIGILANLYSRLYQGLAAAALLPAIFVQVPSGLASQGTLISGVISADSLTGNGGGPGPNVTADVVGLGSESDAMYGMGYGMIEVAIGITVGLFLSSLAVYPLGKRRTGLFSF